MEAFHGSAALAVAVAMAVAPALAAVPLDGIVNGGFENGTAGWMTYGAPPPVVVAPGAAGTGHALLVPDTPGSQAHVTQALGNAVDLHGPLVFEFWAKVDPEPALDGCNAAHASRNWGTSAPFVNVVAVVFCGDLLLFGAYFSEFTPALHAGASLADGEWHHYRAVANPVGALGVLLVDGEVTHAYRGEPTNVGAPMHVHLSEASEGGGSGPTVTYDEVSLGPLA